MKRKVVIVLLAPFIGAILGCLFGLTLNYGWLSRSWHIIEKPPFTVRQLVAMSYDSLWVQNESGQIYFNENASKCQFDCWREVSNVPELPIVDPYYVSVTNESCAPLRPLSNVVEEISECRKEMFRDFNYSFALRKDGNIFFWQATINREWAYLNLFNLTLLGAAFLFIPTLIIVLIMSFLDWLFNRPRQIDDNETAT